MATKQHFQNDDIFQGFPQLILLISHQYVFTILSFQATIFTSTRIYPSEHIKAKMLLLPHYEIIVQPLYNSFPEHIQLTSHNLKMQLKFFLLHSWFQFFENIQCL